MSYTSSKVSEGRNGGLKRCFLTTIFLFCFALFCLYKYLVIDADAVLSRNGKEGAFDNEIGIDVSALRSVTPLMEVDGEWMSQVDKWDYAVKQEGGIRMTYITDDCDQPRGVYGIAFLAKSNRGGVKVVVLVNYTAEKTVEAGAAEAVIIGRFGNVQVVNQTLELCSVDEELLKCPIQKGLNSFRREVVLPAIAPKGKFRGWVVLRYTDTKEIKLCARGVMIL